MVQCRSSRRRRTSQCQTFYEYTNPGQASVTFNNFDMDGNARRSLLRAG